LTIQKSDWAALPTPVKNAVVREIVYYTWGHTKRNYSPLDVVLEGDVVGTSPLAYLAPGSGASYLHFARPESLVGGRGNDSYGPNCWYNAISAIADVGSAYARSQMLAPASWDRPRFLGPTEFRRHMRNFTQVTEPQFGDIIRYYTDAPVYGGLIYGGEIHAAVYVGKETYVHEQGRKSVREIALTKNGRSELDFLIFQDIRALDEAYLPSPVGGASTSGSPGQQPKKGYFRVKRGVALLDPATVGGLSDAHGAFQVDLKNYMDRWLCLGKLIDPPAGNKLKCYSYPAEWMTLPADEPTPSSPLAHTMKTMKIQRAPLLEMKGRAPSSLFPSNRSGFGRDGLAKASSG
jgi:hypothetical protein